ncbi:MAG: helix-turn-helix transcriptional regulator [Bacillota bacterium]
MKKRHERISNLICELEKISGEISREGICKKLGISQITLRRYMGYLEGLGYRFSTGKNGISVKSKGIADDEIFFSKGSYMSFKVLMHIYNNNPCSRLLLKQGFCSDNLKQKMSLRSLDYHINKLIELDYVKKLRKGSELYYEVTDNIIKAEAVPFNMLLNVYNYMKVYKNVLPFKEHVEEILDKLGSSLTNYIRKSSENYGDVKIVHEVFPDCIMEVHNEEQDLMAKNLESWCYNDVVLDVTMKSGSSFRIYPFCVVYNWYTGRWYLVFRHITDDDGYDLLRLDRIKSIKSVGVNDHMAAEVLLAEKMNAQIEVQESFAVCVEEPLKVKVFFGDDREVVEIASKRLNNMEGVIISLNNGGIMFDGYIHGTMDFVTWLKQFGSNVQIISPDFLRDKLIGFAETALRAYEAL